MADTTFTDGVTLTAADWFNDLNRLHYTILGDPATLEAAYTTFNAVAKMKVGTFTRDVSIASGTQAVTGVGFTPKIILLFGAISAVEGCASLGFGDGTTVAALVNNHQNFANVWAADINSALSLNPAPNAKAAVTAIAMNSDGFTLTWVKTNSPTGTANIAYAAFR